jgi:hypothetical protein
VKIKAEFDSYRPSIIVSTENKFCMFPHKKKKINFMFNLLSCFVLQY